MKHETSYHLGIRFLVLVVAMVVVISAAREAFGQVETTTADGLATATFKTGQGTIQINLPDEMLGPVSGSVRAFPAGQTAEEKARNLDVLNTYAIRIQDKDTRVAAGVFRRVFSGSERAVNLILVDRAGKELALSAGDAADGLHHDAEDHRAEVGAGWPAASDSRPSTVRR